MNYGSRAKRTGEKMRKKVVRIDLEDGNKKEYPSVFSTGEDGYNPKRVADVARGDSKTHKGYHWKYI